MNSPRALRTVVFLAVLACCRLFIAPSGSFAESNCGEIADRITHGAIVWTENAMFVQGTAAPNLSESLIDRI